MIAEVPGGYSPRRTLKLTELYEKSRTTKPRCVSCAVRLAYDRANEKYPVCHSCEQKLKAQGQRTPDTIQRSEKRKQGATEREDYAPPMPRLKQARLEANLTQKQLASLANVETNLISDVERGKRRPKKVTAQRVGDALGVSVRELGREELA